MIQSQKNYVQNETSKQVISEKNVELNTKK